MSSKMILDKITYYSGCIGLRSLPITRADGYLFAVNVSHIIPESFRWQYQIQLPKFQSQYQNPRHAEGPSLVQDAIRQRA
jgi:hypothetical protein